MSLEWLPLSIGLVLSTTPALPAGQPGQTVAQAESKRDQARRQKALGDGLLKSGKRQQALQAYKKAAAIDPGWYEPHEAIGNALFSAKQYLAAVEAFKKAVAVEPRYTTGYYNIAFAYRKAGKYKQAAGYYRNYIERKPDDPDAYYGLAATLEAMGKIQPAIDNYMLYAAKEQRPSERQYVVKARNKAQALRKSLGLPEVASKPAATAKPVAAKPVAAKPVAAKPAAASKPAAATAGRPSLTPSTPSASGSAAAASKPAPKAAQPLPALEPDHNRQVADLLAKGDAAMRAKSYTLAMQSYFKAVKLAPRNADALYKLGLVYMATGNEKAARLKWKDALSVDPGHAAAKQALARAEKAASQPAPGKPAVAHPAGRPALRSPSAPAASGSATASAKPAATPAAAAGAASGSGRVAKLLAKGDKYFRHKSFSLAIAAYTHATQLDERNEEALFKLGMAYALSGNYKVAVFKWQKVLKINPHNAAAKRNIERAEAKLGGSRAPKTKAAPQPMPKLQPTGYDALMALARQRKKTGDAQGVLDAVAKALAKKKNDAQALLLRGEALVVLRRFRDAKRAFSAAMIADASLAAPLYGLGEANRLSGDKERAKYYFKMYLQSKAADVSQAKVARAKKFLAQ